MSAPVRRIAGAAFAVVVAACQSAPTATGPAAGGSAAPASTPGPAGTAATGTAGVAADLVTGDGDLFLDPLEGLDGLTSHRATLVWTFTPTGGQGSAWSETTTLRTADDPAVAELVVERTGVAGEPARSWDALVGGVAYSSADDGGCGAGLPDPQHNAIAEPAAQLSLLIGGMPTGTETIGGVEAESFQFDGKAMGLVDPVTATGHAWISPADNLLLRLDVAIDAGSEYFGDGIAGRLEGRYELGDVGAAVAVDLPGDCPAGLIEGPQPTDATNVESVPGSLSLTTGMTVKKAMAFYRDTSLAFGWKATEVAVFQEDPEVAGLSFTKDDLAINVLITPADGGSLVMITAQRT